ncbi:MAG: sulfur oxidation c-type cytochrome SoxA, partial [Burkholderiales bacterium]
MLSLCRAVAALALAALALPLAAQSDEKGLALARQMLAEDNPGELWIERGKKLFAEKRGPNNVSLERCDFGLGPGKLEGASAKLPRYFRDTDRIEDLESRLITCMVDLQGFKREDLVKAAISPSLSNGSDIEALAIHVTARSNGMKMNVSIDHPKEREMYRVGEHLFHRRVGQTDFACVTCHGEPD